MKTSVDRFCCALLLLFLLQGPTFADVAPFSPSVPEPDPPMTAPASQPSWPSWPVVAGSGLFLCGAVMLAVRITRKSRRPPGVSD